MSDTGIYIAYSYVISSLYLAEMALFGPNSVVYAEQLIISPSGEIRLVGVRVEFRPGEVLDDTLLSAAPEPNESVALRLGELLPQTQPSRSLSLSPTPEELTEEEEAISNSDIPSLQDTEEDEYVDCEGEAYDDVCDMDLS